MNLRDFAEQHHFTSRLLADPFWGLDSARVSPTDIQLFYARNRSRSGECADLLDRLQSALILAALNGQPLQASEPLLTHEPPEDPFFLDEFLDLLSPMPHTWRLATVFALEALMEPRDVAELTWRRARALKSLNPVAQGMLTLARAQQHERLPYVFWEWATPSIAAPLLGYPDSIEACMGMSWPRLARLYASMMLVDTGFARDDLLKSRTSAG